LFLLLAFVGHDVQDVSGAVYILVVNEADDAAWDVAFPSFDGFVCMSAWLKSPEDDSF
jgi:hypothetical protein